MGANLSPAETADLSLTVLGRGAQGSPAQRHSSRVQGMDQLISGTGPAALGALEQSSLQKEARVLLGLKLTYGESMPQACRRASQGSGGCRSPSYTTGEHGRLLGLGVACEGSTLPPVFLT